MINKNILQEKINQQINTFTTSTDVNTIVTNMFSANFINSSKSINIESVNDLPDIYQNSISNGNIIFVNSIGLHVISSNNQWITFDGRLVRNDAPIASIYSWGNNSVGRLGDSTTTSRSSPVSVVGGFTDWCAVSAGWAHTAAIRTDGSLWTWGRGCFGQLGNGYAIARSSPVSVVGGFTDWCAVSAGENHTAAVRTNGTIWVWGIGVEGQLGDGTTTSRSSPVSVVGGFTDWCAVGAGNAHTAAIRTNGTFWTWGCGNFGQLGNNCTSNFSSPVSVVGGFTDWCAVIAGSAHTAALRTDGTLWTWGSGNNGRLGDGYALARSSPVSVVGGFTDWCSLSGTVSHIAAIRTNGSLWSWGSGTNGKLGNNCTSNFSSPVSVLGGFTDWCAVSAGNQISIGLRTNGTIWSWGSNQYGKLGFYGLTFASSPVSVVGGFTDWCAVSAGGEHTIGLRING